MGRISEGLDDLAHRTRSSPHLPILVGIVVLGGLLRFVTIDLQSYRYDEAVTVARILQPSLFDTVASIPGSESAPPLYYIVAWFWSRPFGTGEVWMRSLSALAGTASIVVVYLGARALPLPSRAALIAAAMVAVNPVLIWFSQDARAYALVFLLTALAFLFFARARHSGARSDLAWWVLFSSLGLATHYFVGLVIAPMALLLLLDDKQRRDVVVAIAVLVAATAALAPIALHQADNAHASWISEQPLGERIERTAAKLVGADNGDEHGGRQPGRIPLGASLLLGAAALVLLLWGGSAGERRGAGIAALVGVGSILLALLMGAVGSDYFNGRNLQPSLVPLIILLAAGFGVARGGRLGLGLTTLFLACSLVFSLEINREPRLQREDLRHAAAEVGPPRPDSAVVTIRYSASQPLAYYLDAAIAKGPIGPLREIVLVGSGAAARHAKRLLPDFKQVESKPVTYNFTLTRLRAPRPIEVPFSTLKQGSLVGGESSSAVLSWPRLGPARSASGAAAR